MKRYQGEALPANARVAVIANDALGNYVVVTPLLEMLRARYPEGTLDLWSGGRTEEFWRQDERLSNGFALYGPGIRTVVPELTSREYDLVINVESSLLARCAAGLAASEATFVVGPTLRADGRSELPFSEDDRGQLQSDPEWISETLQSRYPFLQSSFIGEIFCRLAYLDGPIPKYRVPSADPGDDVPELLIATSASLPEKLWPVEKWSAAASFAQRRGWRVGLLGAKPAAQSQYWQGADAESILVRDTGVEDWRGRWTLPQVAGALTRARAVLTLDNGILHLSAATDTPTVGLFRHGIHRLWAPPAENVTVLTPANDEAVSTIEIDRVTEALCIG